MCGFSGIANCVAGLKIGNGKEKSNSCLLPTLSLFIPQKSDLVTGLSFKR